VISPYVRRLRLARELRRLREREGYTHPKLAAAIGENRAKISRLENAHIRPDPADILKILDVLGVEGEEWSTIMTITREAAERGWWESSIAAMGERQARTADLEAGAVTIWEYQTTFPPGLLQTEAYTRALSEWDDLALGGSRSDPDAMADARAGRQRMLRRRHNEVTYEVIIDEEAIRRPSAPLDVFAEQLRHLADVDYATVLVLPVEVHIEQWTVPRSGFSRYTYRDPQDPVVISVDTVTEDLMVTDPAQVQRYETLYARMRAAALTAEASAELLRDAAERMSHKP
jgi:transcriptional regulator with XRE-family HTH domain